MKFGTNTGKRKRLNPLDIIQATLRCPQYIKDCEAWRKITEQERHCDVPKNVIILKRVRKWNVPLVSDIETVRKKPTGLYYYAPHPIAEVHLLDSNSRPQSSPEGCSYITIRIDLQHSLKKVLEDTILLVSFYHKLSNPPKGRIRNSSIDPWKVYDARKEGKTYKEIVMLLDPTQDKGSLLSRIDTARKAYEKACKMIKAVDPTPTIGR